MAAFAAVELRQDAPLIVLIIHAGQHVKGFRDTSQGREGGNSARLDTIFCSAATQRPEPTVPFGLLVEAFRRRRADKPYTVSCTFRVNMV